MNIMNMRKKERKSLSNSSNSRFRASRILSNNSKSSSRSTQKRYGSYADSVQSISSNHRPDQSYHKNITYAHLIGKYLGNNGKHTQLHDEMSHLIEQKNMEIETLKIYRDELKMIKDLSKKGSLRKIQLDILKEKVKVENQIRQQKYMIKKKMVEMTYQEEEILQYCSWVVNSFNNGSILDLAEERQILQENLQFEADYMLRQLGKTKRKNAYEIKKMEDEIMGLRVNIKGKENTLQQLKAKIFSLHMKLNQRNQISSKQCAPLPFEKSSSRQQTNRYVYFGNNRVQKQSKEIPSSYKLKKIIIFRRKKDILGIFTLYQDDKYRPLQECPRDIKILDQFIPEQLLGLKIYYSSKIVGIEYRRKSDSEILAKQYGDCFLNFEHKFIPFVNKTIERVIPHWHSQDMVGVGIEFREKEKSKPKYQRARLMTHANPQSKVFAQYYN